MVTAYYNILFKNTFRATFSLHLNFVSDFSLSIIHIVKATFTVIGSSSCSDFVFVFMFIISDNARVFIYFNFHFFRVRVSVI